MRHHGLRDDQFTRIETLLPGRPVTVGRRGNELFVEAVIWKFGSGAPWWIYRRFGDWKNTHKRVSRWARAASGGVFQALADDPDNEYAMTMIMPPSCGRTTGLLVSRCDTSKLLDRVEEALDNCARCKARSRNRV